jgi:hypothetical protein
MGLTIGNHLFYGPFQIEKVVIRKNHRPAIFAVVTRSGEPWNPVFRLLDLGYSGRSGFALAEHSRVDEWRRQSDGVLQIYLYDLDSRDELADVRAGELVDELTARYARPHDAISIGG